MSAVLSAPFAPFHPRPRACLERALSIFKRLHPRPLGAQDIAVQLGVDIELASKYINRLKSAGEIEQKAGRKGSKTCAPVYGLADRKASPFEFLLPRGTESMNGTSRIAPEAIVLLSPEIQSAAAVREAVRLDDVASAHPMHEVFVLWFRQDLNHPFAVVMRISKARIAKDGWPLIVDPETRVVAFEAAVKD